MRSANAQSFRSITRARTVAALVAGSVRGAVLTSAAYALFVAASGQPRLGLWMGVAAFPLSCAYGARAFWSWAFRWDFCSRRRDCFPAWSP